MIGPLAFWFAMACWEVYDQHPDHLIAYSIIPFAIIVRRVSSTPLPTRKKEPR